MSSQNRILATIIITSAFLVVGIATHLLFRQPAATPRLLLLYTSRPSFEIITNWIVNTDTGEKWEVGNGLAAWHWSPSGKYLVFHTLSPLPRQIWISNSDGSNLHKVLDSKDYPNLEIKDFDWLSDEMIIVNVVSKTENSGFVYLLDINSLSFERHNIGNFLRVSPNGKFWVQWTNQDKYHLMDLDGKAMPLPNYLSDYYFSPTENKIAYSCAGKYKFSSLCIADVSMSEITNEQKIAENAFLSAYGEAWWSLDGKYIGVTYSTEETKETKFKAIDISNGIIVFDWAFPTKTTRNFWSPRNDKIIDYDGLLLDLKTGQVSNFFEEIGETVPSYVVDWRMIEVH
jgi:hypothetical protein